MDKNAGAVFAAIDTAARPGVQFRHGWGGKFKAGRGNSTRSEKVNSYPFAKVATYLACVVGVLGLLYGTGSFISPMINADDLSDVLVTKILELPSLARDQAAGPWKTESGAVRFRLHKIYGEFSYLNMPRGFQLLVYIRVLGLWALFFIGTVQLAKILGDLYPASVKPRASSRRDQGDRYFRGFPPRKPAPGRAGIDGLSSPCLSL